MWRTLNTKVKRVNELTVPIIWWSIIVLSITGLNLLDQFLHNRAFGVNACYLLRVALILTRLYLTTYLLTCEQTISYFELEVEKMNMKFDFFSAFKSTKHSTRVRRKRFSSSSVSRNQRVEISNLTKIGICTYLLFICDGKT